MGSPGHIAVMVITYLSYIFTIALNGFASLPESSSGIYTATTGIVSSQYNTLLTPSSWAFSIWGVIFLWQAIWLVFTFATFFIPTNDGSSRLYYKPNILSIPFYIMATINFHSLWVWLIVWDRSNNNSTLVVVSSAILYFSAITCYITIALSYKSLDSAIPELEQDGKGWVKWCVRVFVHNGLSLYAGWLTVASTLNLCIALVYYTGVHPETATLACTAVLLVIILVYVLCDTFLLDRYTRYTITPHLLLIWALTAVYTRNCKYGASYSIFQAVLLGIAVFATVKKIILLIVRHVMQNRNMTKV